MNIRADYVCIIGTCIQLILIKTRKHSSKTLTVRFPTVLGSPCNDAQVEQV